MEKDVWKNAKLFDTYQAMLTATTPNAVFIGIPPIAHGEVEITCAKAGIHMFIEKPIHCGPVEKVKEVLAEISKKDGLVVSVGYMLRYCKATEFIKKSLGDSKPISILARYNSAYVSIPKPMWWDIRRSGGPIIEQGTHFCDLLRYFGGDIDMSTVSCIQVPPTSSLGKLSKIPPGCEDGVPDEFKIPRATQAVFAFSSGAVGTLSHAALLHGTKYHTEFEIWSDGTKILLSDPYSENCTVYVNDVPTKFPDDDPYLTEDRAFFAAIKTPSLSTEIKSPYSDAVKTYEFSHVLTHNAKKAADKH